METRRVKDEQRPNFISWKQGELLSLLDEEKYAGIQAQAVNFIRQLQLPPEVVVFADVMAHFASVPRNYFRAVTFQTRQQDGTTACRLFLVVRNEHFALSIRVELSGKGGASAVSEEQAARVAERIGFASASA